MRKFFTILVLAVAGLLAAAAMAQTPVTEKPRITGSISPSASLPASAASRLTATDAEAWLDGFIPYALKRGGIPGAVVVIVKDGNIIVEKGYGFADLRSGKRVDAKTTLFRPGSISKLFTWTAVMQLVDAGRIDLDADVNRYLDFRIPAFEGRPITMRNIMTHTAGFEETSKVLILSDAKNLPSLERELKRWVPTRVFRPGTTPAYSNYASALAGYVVQRVSGQPFEAYIEDHIFKPLGMTRSSFRQPLPVALRPGMSQGYMSADAPPVPYEFISIAPAGSLASTGHDIGRFMLAHLGNGALDGKRILSDATAREMHDFSLPLIGPLNTMTLGFFEERIDGHRSINHGGSTGVFHSRLSLFPDEGVGIYISVNAAGRQGASSAIRSYLFESFVSRYLPVRQSTGKPVDRKTADAHAALMASQSYLMSRGSFTSFAAMTNLFSQATIAVNDDGTISPSFPPDYSGAPRRYRETAPYVWDQIGGKGRLAAVVKDGKVVMWSFSEFSPAVAFLPVAPLMASRLLLPVLGFALIVLLLTAASWPTAAVMRRHYGAPFRLTGQRAISYRASRALALLSILALAGWAFIFSKLSGSLQANEWLGQHDAVVLIVQAVSVIAFGGGLIVSGWYCWTVWTRGGGWFARLWSVLLVLALMVFLWTFAAYKMLNFSLNY